MADEQELEVTWPEFLQQLEQSIWASEQDVPTDEAVAIAQHAWQLTVPSQDQDAIWDMNDPTPQHHSYPMGLPP